MAALSHCYFPNSPHSAGTPCFVFKKATNSIETFGSLWSPQFAVFLLLCTVTDTLKNDGKGWLMHSFYIQGVCSVSSILYVFPVSNGYPLITHECVLFTAKSVPHTEMWIQKGPWHGSVGRRRCSCKATERTGLAVIWHTVKDPRNLHSDCVPVGRAELCLSLAMLLLAPIPKLASALLRELERRGPGQRVYCGRLPSLPLLNIQQHIHGHVYMHAAERRRALLHLWVPTSRMGFDLCGISALKCREGSSSV